MKNYLPFELFAGQDFLAVKTNKKIFKISLKGFNLKISEISINDLLVPVKVHAVSKNRLNLKALRRK
jgi:hypothetical protein